MVVAPGAEGDFGVLPGHSPFVSTLRPGCVILNPESESPMRFVITEGLAEVTPEHCIILTEQTIKISTPATPEEKAAAEQALAEATQRLDRSTQPEARHLAEKQMLLAETTLAFVA